MISRLRKILAAFLFLLQLAALSSLSMPQVRAQGEATLSSRCSSVISEADSNQVRLSDTQKGEIYAVLGESISPNAPKKVSFNCSQLISCLEQKYFNSPARDTLIVKDLKDKYSYCLVVGKDGVDLLANYASMVYQWIAGIVGGICILIIVFSGIQISLGGVSQEEVSTAKDRIFRSLGGMVILFLSAFILYTINPLFFT